MELAQNPFFILNVTTRNDRRRILEIAEEKSLLSDEDSVRGAAATLTNPRKRLSAEVAWLPGLSSKQIAEVMAVLDANPTELCNQRELPVLARANLLAASLVRAVTDLDAADAANWIVDLAETHEALALNAESTATLINEERAIAGFPKILDLQHIKSELRSRRQYYRTAIKDALNKLPPKLLVEVVTQAVRQATKDGKDHYAPILIHDLVDSFEVEAQGFLEKEEQNISLLVNRVMAAVKANKDDKSHIDRSVVKLENVIRNWDAVAQPIQLSARSRGLDHDQSRRVARTIRKLARELFNKHGLLDISRRLTMLQQEVFAEIDRVVEQSIGDASALLDEIEKQLKSEEQQVESLRRELTYEADIGIVFKNRLRISPDGVEWKGDKFPLKDITRIRWGGTKHSINGIPTGTTYNIFVGSDWGSTSIELKNEQVYKEFVDRLWRTVGTRLAADMLEGLRQGKRYGFGTAVISDHGVELERRHFFSANELVFCKWTDLVIGNGSGTFYIVKKDEKKVSVELPYQDMDNVRVLEAAMRVFWKKASHKLSDLLARAN